MALFPPAPTNFRVTAVRIVPSVRISLAWDEYDNNLLRDDILHSNVEGQKAAQQGINSDRVSAHNRYCVGYELWRKATCDFTPPQQGTQLADETTLEHSTTEYHDDTAELNHVYYYKLAAKIQQ